MILLVHMLFGAAIGASIKNPYLAIVLALASHYFLDIFPHVEYLKSTEDSIKNLRGNNLRQAWKDVAQVSTDFALGIFFIFLFSYPATGYQPIIYWCALAAIVPDGLTIISNLFPNRLSTAHDKIHTGKIHYLTKQKNFPISWKISTQVAVMVISIILLKI